jgi:hypothetical protein
MVIGSIIAQSIYINELTKHYTRWKHTAELDNLSRGQTQFLIIIEHCVHVLNPDRVNRTIEQHPFQVGVVFLDTQADQYAKNTILPFMLG